MALSANVRQNIWKEHKDSLTRIRSQLSDHKSSTQAAGPPGKRLHSPYGNYRPETPPHLPRLSETPEHEKHRKSTNLRRRRYDIVPPVKESKRVESKFTDYDSWGEESEDEASDGDQGDYMPYPYPMQYSHPAPVVFGAPFPVFYPPPPPQQNRGKNQKRRRKHDSENLIIHDRRPSPVRAPSRSPLAERHVDNRSERRAGPTRSEPHRSPNRSTVLKAYKKKARVRFDPPVNGYYGYPGLPYAPYPYGLPETYGVPEYQRPEKRDSRYKYINPRDTPYSPTRPHGDSIPHSFADDANRLAYYYTKDHPIFAEQIVEWFISQCLDEIIPDLLIDALNEFGTSQEGMSPLHQVRDEIVASEVQKMTHDIVRKTLDEMVNEYMLFTQQDKDPLESFLNRLIDDAVHDATTDVVKETVREMAREYVSAKHEEVVFHDLFLDFLDEIGPKLVEEAVFDVLAEEFISEQVINPEVDDEVPIVAQEVLSYYDSKVIRRELKEVSSQAGDKLIESIMLDYILSLVARQGNVWTESDHANKFMDDILSSILIEKMFSVTEHRRKTVANKPLRKLHQKVVTDVALDVLLQQLTASLDEDLLDVDEYERGITEPYGSFSTPMKSFTST